MNISTDIFLIEDVTKDIHNLFLDIISKKFFSNKKCLIVYDLQKKPNIKCNDLIYSGISFSDTSCKKVALFSLVNKRVGVDIENIIFSKELINSFLSEEESVFLKKISMEEFIILGTKIWTLKESFVKALGLGFVVHPNQVCVFDLIFKKEEQNGFIKYDNQVFSIKILLSIINKDYVISGIVII